MARLIGFLVAISTLALASCSSGVSNTGAGAANTDCITGPLDLTCTMVIELESSSIDPCPAFSGEGEEVVATIGPSTIATLNIRVSDPLGEFSNTFQGITWETFDVSFNSGQGGAPVLGSRRFTQTFIIEFDDSVAQGTVEIPVADQVTYAEFREQASCSTVYPYVMTVRATGRDFVTNTPIVVVARITIEMGDFLNPGESGGDGDGRRRRRRRSLGRLYRPPRTARDGHETDPPPTGDGQ